MLVLTRKVGDSILIGDSIKIQVVKVKGCQVRLGIEAPKETKVFRQEVLEGIKKGSSVSSKEKIAVGLEKGTSDQPDSIQRTMA